METGIAFARRSGESRNPWLKGSFPVGPGLGKVEKPEVAQSNRKRLSQERASLCAPPVQSSLLLRPLLTAFPQAVKSVGQLRVGPYDAILTEFHEARQHGGCRLASVREVDPQKERR